MVPGVLGKRFNRILACCLTAPIPVEEEKIKLARIDCDCWAVE